MYAKVKNRLINWDWHGAWLINLGSPSSHSDKVKRIVEEFVLPVGASARILDIGGTRQGFVSRLNGAYRDLRSRIYLVNPRGGEEIAYRSLASIPDDTEPFDLAMMFGVMVYEDEPQVMEMFRTVRRFLRPGGAFIVANPDGEHFINRADRPFKAVVGLPTILYTAADTVRLLRAAGFTDCEPRPDLRGNALYFAVAARKGEPR